MSSRLNTCFTTTSPFSSIQKFKLWVPTHNHINSNNNLKAKWARYVLNKSYRRNPDSGDLSPFQYGK